ncbi:hypothetical protein SK128_015876, partial [Halocaridina rubra]
APPRELDRLRALSPLSQRCRRSPSMNPRTPLLLTSRGGASSATNGDIGATVSRTQGSATSQRETAAKSVRAPSTPVSSSSKSVRTTRAGPVRPTRVNTAVTGTTRKVSAPSKLI